MDVRTQRASASTGSPLSFAGWLCLLVLAHALPLVLAFAGACACVAGALWVACAECLRTAA